MEDKVATEEVKASTPETPVEEIKTGVQESDASQDQEAGKPDPILDAHWQTNPFFYDVANYFNVQARDYDVAKGELGTIVDYVVDKYGVKAPEDVLLKIRELEDSIQRPGWDEKRYSTLYRYVRLATQALSVEKAMSAFRKSK